MRYSDSRIELGDTELRVRSLRSERRVAVGEIGTVTSFDLSRWGARLRLVGVGFDRPRTWFVWDPDRRHKTRGVELDIGRVLRLGLTPDDPEALVAALEAHPERVTDD